MSSQSSVFEPSRSAFHQLRALIELTKPGVTRLVVATTAFGAAMAPGVLDPVRLVVVLLGTVMVVAAANALNMAWEPELDAKMTRTAARPIPSGRMARESAVIFGVALSVFGLAILRVGTGPLPTLLAAVALASYVLVYTPLKAVTPWALQVGALPGAMPPLIGWAALAGSLDALALAVAGVLFVWQIPHFLAIAIFRQEEYARAGLRVLSVVRGTAMARRALVLWSVVLLGVSLVPAALGMGGVLYVAAALLTGTVFLLLALRGFWVADVKRWARGVFFASMPYLVVLYCVLLLDTP